MSIAARPPLLSDLCIISVPQAGLDAPVSIASFAPVLRKVK